MNLYLLSSYFVNLNITANSPEKMTAESFTISPENEIAFKTSLICNYLSKRNKTFDFLYLGENEEINIL